MASSSENHVRYAATMFQKQLAPLITMTPYSNSFYHASALLHPFSHGLKALVGLGRSVAGLYENSEEAPKKEFLTAMINIANAIVSFVAFIARTIAVVINLGYSADKHVEKTDKDIHEGAFNLMA